MAAVAGGLTGFALACTQPAAAQQADQPAAEGGPGEIVVAARPDSPASVELVKGPQDTLSGVPTDGGAAAAEPKMLASGLEGFIEGSVGSYGQRAIGGGVAIPLAQGKGLLRIEGYESHFGVR